MCMNLCINDIVLYIDLYSSHKDQRLLRIHSFSIGVHWLYVFKAGLIITVALTIDHIGLIQVQVVHLGRNKELLYCFLGSRLIQGPGEQL